MRNSSNTLGSLAAVAALAAGNALMAGTAVVPANAVTPVNTKPQVDFELHAGYTNEYLFRGLNLGQHLVEVGADVSTVAYGFELSADAWYGTFENADFGPFHHSDVRELDLYGQVARDFGILTGSVGYIYRTFDSSDDSNLENQEVYFGLSRQFFGIDTSLIYFWGVEKDNDGYSEFALHRGFKLSPCLTLKCDAALGYLVEQGELTALTNRLALDWNFTRTAKLSPFVKWSVALSDDNDTAYLGSKNQIVGGMMLSVGF